MKKLLIIVAAVVLFTNCNNSAGGWSSQERQKGLKACMDQTEGKLEEATARKFCNCALEKAMQKWKSYAESEKAPDDDPAGIAIGENCMAAIQRGDNPEEKKGKGGGLFGGKGDGWSKADKNNFVSPCENGLAQNGYSEAQSRQLCSCMLGKLEKKYSSLQQANDQGGEAAGAQVRQECEGGGGDDN